MSYSFSNPCYNCKKYVNMDNNPENPCKDEEKIRTAIDSIHASRDGSHQGCGKIVLMCCKMVPTFKD